MAKRELPGNVCVRESKFQLREWNNFVHRLCRRRITNVLWSCIIMEIDFSVFANYLLSAGSQSKHMANFLRGIEWVRELEENENMTINTKFLLYAQFLRTLLSVFQCTCQHIPASFMTPVCCKDEPFLFFLLLHEFAGYFFFGGERGSELCSNANCWWCCSLVFGDKIERFPSNSRTNTHTHKQLLIFRIEKNHEHR